MEAHRSRGVLALDHLEHAMVDVADLLDAEGDVDAGRAEDWICAHPLAAGVAVTDAPTDDASGLAHHDLPET
jgi:hypothetical protein